MRSLLEHVKAVTSAYMTEIRDDHLHMKVFFNNPDDLTDTWQLDIAIPIDDLKGGTFTASMYADDPETTHPKFLQRWIRKALEEQAVVEKARAEWNNGQ